MTGEAPAFEPPGWGSWQQDRAHNPHPMTTILQHLHPPGIKRGFAEAFETYGVPIQSVTFAFVEGYPYLRMHFAGEPGDGPADPSETGAFIGRCTAAAEATFATRPWRASLALWDDELKPASVRRHRELGDVDLASLDELGLAEHLAACFAHHDAMAYQHHRFNTASMVPVGDLLLQASMWTGLPPHALLGLFEGMSPISGTWSDEIAAAATALAGDREALAIARDVAQDPGQRLDELRASLPEVDDYVRNVGMRLLDGFDVNGPTLLEVPSLLVGKLVAAADAGGPPSTDGAVSDDVRAKVPEEHRDAFDDLLAEARLVYRLRDERGTYSDMASAGLLRLSLLELGRRLTASGALETAEHAFDLTPDEALDLAKGVAGPSAAEVRRRADAREAAEAFDAPPFLGSPPSPPPPPDALPPALGRMAGAMGFIIGAILGEVEQPSTSGDIVGLPGSGGTYEGRARLILDIADLATLEPGDVLVAKTTSEAFNCAIHLVGAMVTDHGGIASHAAIVSREVGIPAVVGTVNGTSRIPDGAIVVVDGHKGTVTVRS